MSTARFGGSDSFAAHPTAWAITVVQLPGYVHSAALAEVAESLWHAFRELGYDAVLTPELDLPGRRHLIVGWHLLPHTSQRPAANAILYNLEQVDSQSSWLAPAALDLVRSYEVWDYSERNAKAWQAYGVQPAHCLPIGYVPALTRIAPAANKDIDVLFYGSLNERRNAVLEALQQAGAQVHSAFGVYGEQRDALIARSRVVINIHYYEAKVLEVVRLSYLLANGCVVVTENSCEPEVDALYSGGCRVVAFADLVEATLAMLRDATAQRRYAESAMALMQGMPLTPALAEALRLLATRSVRKLPGMAALFGAPGGNGRRYP